MRRDAGVSVYLEAKNFGLSERERSAVYFHKTLSSLKE